MQVSLDNSGGMRSGRARPWRALACAALACALLAAGWWRTGPHTVLPLPAVAVPSDAAAPSDGYAPAADPMLAHDDTGARPPQALATAAGPRRAGLRHGFETDDDLFAYSRRLLPAVQAGDAEATWLLARVVDYCASAATDPAGFARDSALLAGMRLPAARTIAGVRARVGARCARFDASDGLSPLRVRQLRLQAARAGSLGAEAELLAAGEPLSAAPGYANGLLERIGRAGDAEAFGALSGAADVAGWFTLVDGQVAPQYRTIVWQLAACRMGMDCGPHSALMTAYCVNGGICSRQPEQSFEAFVYDAAVPRQGADLVEVAVEGLVERFGGQP